VPTQSEYNLEVYNNEAHDTILYAAALEGIDISPMVGAKVRYIGYGDTKHGYGPCCIVDVAGTDYMAEPHVTWFPWTTPANCITNFKWAMEHLSQDKEVMLIVEKDQKSFFEHFVRRGVLRKVGHLKNIPIHEEIHMYQYERKKK